MSRDMMISHQSGPRGNPAWEMVVWASWFELGADMPVSVVNFHQVSEHSKSVQDSAANCAIVRSQPAYRGHADAPNCISLRQHVIQQVLLQRCQMLCLHRLPGEVEFRRLIPKAVRCSPAPN